MSGFGRCPGGRVRCAGSDPAHLPQQDPFGWAASGGVPGPALPLMVLPHSVWEDEEMLLVLSWCEDLGA